MINQLNIPIDAALSARLAEAGRHYNTNEQGIVLRALEDFFSHDTTHKQELEEDLVEDECRFQKFLQTGECVSNDDVMAWIDGEIAAITKQLSCPK